MVRCVGWLDCRCVSCLWSEHSRSRSQHTRSTQSTRAHPTRSTRAYPQRLRLRATSQRVALSAIRNRNQQQDSSVSGGGGGRGGEGGGDCSARLGQLDASLCTSHRYQAITHEERAEEQRPTPRQTLAYCNATRDTSLLSMPTGY
jgi:hypothetical protein